MYPNMIKAAGQQWHGGFSVRERELSNCLRMLWEQHVFWTRLVISGIAFASPDVACTTERLLRNPKDFEAALRIFYGERLAAEFAELLTCHLTIAGDLFKAAKACNNAAVSEAEKCWYANADQIAAFLARINPCWTKTEWQKMFYSHLAMTKTEAMEMLTGKYADSICTFDTIEREALVMADCMTQGIVQQFSNYFRQ